MKGIWAVLAVVLALGACSGTPTPNTPTNLAPAVTTQPGNQTVTESGTATFMAAASGNPAPTVQWQVSTNNGSTFSNVSGATANTYAFTAVAADNGKQFRAVFTNSVGTVTTSAATLTVPTPVLPPLVVLDASGLLASGFNILVNTDRSRTDWLSPAGADGLQAAYPSGQQFGFVAIVLSGATAPGTRPSRDLSAYKSLQIQLRGAAGGESVDIGIKDNTNPDDGTEVKKTVALSSSWQTFTFTLTDFTRSDLRRLYLVLELVFNGTTGRTVFFRDVRYVQ